MLMAFEYLNLPTENKYACEICTNEWHIFWCNGNVCDIYSFHHNIGYNMTLLTGITLMSLWTRNRSKNVRAH